MSLKDYNVKDLKDIAKINKIALNLERMKELGMFEWLNE